MDISGSHSNNNNNCTNSSKRSNDEDKDDYKHYNDDDMICYIFDVLLLNQCVLLGNKIRPKSSNPHYRRMEYHLSCMKLYYKHAITDVEKEQHVSSTFCNDDISSACFYS